MTIKCRNPACNCDTFNVEIEYKKQELQIKSGDLSVPVVLVCTKCKQKQHAYVVNNQLREIVRNINIHDRKLTQFIEEMHQMVEAAQREKEPLLRRLLRRVFGDNRPIMVELHDDGLEELGIE